MTYATHPLHLNIRAVEKSSYKKSALRKGNGNHYVLHDAKASIIVLHHLPKPTCCSQEKLIQHAMRKLFYSQSSGTNTLQNLFETQYVHIRTHSKGGLPKQSTCMNTWSFGYTAMQPITPRKTGIIPNWSSINWFANSVGFCTIKGRQQKQTTLAVAPSNRSALHTSHTCRLAKLSSIWSRNKYTFAQHTTVKRIQII